MFAEERLELMSNFSLLHLVIGLGGGEAVATYWSSQGHLRIIVMLYIVIMY